MRIILDTNIYVSALISKNFRQRLSRIFDDLSIHILTDSLLMAEIEEVITRPKISKYLTPTDRDSFVTYLKNRCELVDVTSLVSISPDPDDDFLLALSKDGQANYLITGNKRDLLDLKQFEDTRIVTLTELLSLLG
ncbi:putative toxin-antitoxin system toxin component, PIN family [Larkinella rosea]|uniref:Putative toxin-antitoxin system toxin component, PIN family n=1 Tax=Larkinella rosea TaxID=2025312 RepID=A0A3P1BJL2_9BACT|nr:putative toxin-antitoxin system toxin component, PIN family [Larkinella rosea]RRB01013.1 putative toxin-antitoxin system toxin component, PIN family [Larkinella rosea]